MASNYKELYKIKDRCWSTECPVLLESAGLFMNNNTNAIIALCKFRNIAIKRLKAVYLSMACLGVDGEILNDGLDYVYLDLSVSNNDIFGEKNPISIPDATTRKIDISVKKVVFEDDTYWENPDNNRLQPILSTNPSSILGDLMEAYEWKTGFAFLPLEQSDYWICGCNGFNPSTNKNCINCGTEKKVVFDQTDKEYIMNSKLEMDSETNNKLAIEKDIQDELAKKKEAQIKLMKRILTITIPLVIVILIFYVYISEPLTQVVADSNIKKLNWQLKMGKDPNLNDSQNKVPLNIAVENNNIEAVRLLITHGAEANKKDGAGLTPLDISRNTDDKDIQMLLIKYGAEGYIEEKINLTVGASLDSSNIYDNTRRLSETVETTVRTYYSNANPSKVEYYFTCESFGGTAFGWTKEKYLYVGSIKENTLDGNGSLYIYREGVYDKRFKDYVICYEGGFRNGKYDGKGCLYWDIIFSVNKADYGKNPPILNAEFKEGNVYGQYTRYYNDKSLNDTGTCYDGKTTSSKYGYSEDWASRFLDVKLP